MKPIRTAAHWGSYFALDGANGPELKPDPSDPAPSQIGRGWVPAMKDKSLRIERPAIRKGWLEGDKGAARCDDQFVEVPMQEATKRAADELRRIIQSHGNRAIYGGSYGWASAGRFHHAQSQLRRFLNSIGGFTASRDTYSHAAAEVLLPHITGMSNKAYLDNMTSWPLIAKHCDILLAFGGISGLTAQITSSGTSTHEVEHWLNAATERGMELVNISPQKSDVPDTSRTAWLPIRPGTDVSLMLGLAYEILRQNAHDETFLARFTSGWPELRAYVTGAADGVAKTPEWAATICTIPADAIRALAARIIGRRVMIAVNWAVQRTDHGEQPLWMGLALAAMLGQIGKPGTGFGFGYGSTTPIGRPARLIDWPSVPQGANPVTDFIPVARITDMLESPGSKFIYNGETRRYPDARLIYWAGGNPFHHHQDLNRLERAWTRPETVIVHDHSWTATARRADIVLPSTSPLERDDIMINRRDPALIYMSKLMEPPAEALNDHQIFAQIAAHLDLADAFTEKRGEEDWLRWLWEKCAIAGKNEGFALPDFDRFRELGQFDVPDSFEVRIQMGGFTADPGKTPLKTESGKLTLFNKTIAVMNIPGCPGHPAWIPPIEWLGDSAPGQLHLISGQPPARLHSQLDNGSEARRLKIRGREPCCLHPQTAARFGIEAGDIVEISNGRGACLAGATLGEGIRTDCISLPTGAWFDPQVIDGRQIEVHGNPNVLTIDKGTSGLAQGNIAHTALVRIKKWDQDLPALRVKSAPLLPPPGAQHGTGQQ